MHVVAVGKGSRAVNNQGAAVRGTIAPTYRKRFFCAVPLLIGKRHFCRVRNRDPCDSCLNICGRWHIFMMKRFTTRSCFSDRRE